MTLYKGIVIKSLWLWYEDRLIDHWNRMESPEVDKCAKVIWWGNGSFYNKWYWNNSHEEKINLDTYLMLYTKINLK